MHRDLQLDNWTAVCAVDDILPDTGVCALLGGEQVAVFRLNANDAVYAIGNVDPKSGASVLARGLVGSVGERVVVASPLYKQHFDLRTGECIEAPAQSVPAYPARIEQGLVWVRA
ncbi:nitrite reductase small subunit NirD [Massilia arenosa]|uniref:Nitrite reductase small subunit NirD n=1 Tax=Zemynaea arenosa TaxID=2561931 RepID=A0A4Y9SAR5_9BURK|nr:nitrite reductase small subunit NirD [Massilia arenosa]TFW19077.1 nitrite reductase small subunit NirD [Massilia arenosa]